MRSLMLCQKLVPGFFLKGKGNRPACKADNLTAICEHCLDNVGSSTSHNPMAFVIVCYKDSFIYFKDVV
jgi:hypothetical protein